MDTNENGKTFEKSRYYFIYTSRKSISFCSNPWKLHGIFNFFTSFCKTFHRNILISIIFSYILKVVFGGYSHKHNQVETCQDSNLYFFHLGCQNWVSRRILEHSPFGREYPKNQGLFGHSSAVRRKNMLIISGGYHGSISSDILAYTLPYGLSLKRNDKVIYYRHEV